MRRWRGHGSVGKDTAGELPCAIHVHEGDFAMAQAGGSAAGTGTPVPPLISGLLVQKLSPTMQTPAPAPSPIRPLRGMLLKPGLHPCSPPNSAARTAPSTERWKKVINLQRKKC